MRHPYGLPFDLEKLFQSVRRLNIRQIDRPDPEQKTTFPPLPASMCL